MENLTTNGFRTPFISFLIVCILPRIQQYAKIPFEKIHFANEIDNLLRKDLSDLKDRGDKNWFSDHPSK